MLKGFNNSDKESVVMATCGKASVAADKYHGEKFYERFCYSLLFQISHFHLNTEQVLIRQVVTGDCVPATRFPFVLCFR